MSKNGLILLTPTSASSSEGTTTINANGSISLTNVQYLRVEGVFSADYDNYMIVAHYDPASLTAWQIRLMSGSTIDGASNYTTQILTVDSTTVSAYRTGPGGNWVCNYGDTTANGCVYYLYGPYLAQPTAIRCVDAGSRNGAYINDIAGTHSLSSSYDGIFMWVGAACTGRVAVYGMRK